MEVVIYFEEEFLGVYPSLINCITLLSPVSKSITVISSERKSNFPEPPTFPSNVSFRKIKQELNYDRNQNDFITEHNKNKIVQNISSQSWKKIIPQFIKVTYRKYKNYTLENLNRWQEQRQWFLEKFKYYLFCLSNAFNNKPKVIIAVDESGLIAGMLVKIFSGRTRPKLVFWSLETGLETGKSFLLLHRIHEIAFSQSAKFIDTVVTQEESRLADLEKKLNYTFPKIPKFFIPHSPIGKSDILSNELFVKNNFFKKKFSLQKNDKIILHAGWIHDSMFVDKIAEASKTWNSNFKLVLHEREKRSLEDSFISYVSKLSDGKALFSLSPVTFDRIDEVISSAHIGLIAYDRKYGDGRINIRKSSGKLAQYLKCGVPVIALDLPGYKKMFEKYNCGLVFQNFEEIENCINVILKNYNHFSSESIRCFEEEFDFKKFFRPFVSDILKTSEIKEQK